LLASYFRELVETDELMQDVWVEGEISSFTVAGSGHAYFAIKDETAAVDCVMWKPARMRQSFQPSIGDKVVVHGGATVYERTTRFQIKADVIYPAGAGIMQLQLEQLKQRLEAEGLFDPSRKRPLPQFPERIGVATSATGAVWHDIQHVLRRRYPLAHLVLAPTVVQGDKAPDSVVSSLRRLQDEGVDVIILARGGGSAEDLWAFNDERIARAVFASSVVVVSAIGHETDTSIADMVADLRAPTPSAAAEMVVPDIRGISLAIEEVMLQAQGTARDVIARRSREVTDLHHRLSLMSPKAQLVAMNASLASETTRMRAAASLLLERRTHELDRAASLLEALNPAAHFKRGFAHIANERSGETVRSAGMLGKGDRIRATFGDGMVGAMVQDVSTTSHS
jgi:exodeoxyribonuclease VII large subunit